MAENKNTESLSSEPTKVGTPSSAPPEQKSLSTSQTPTTSISQTIQDQIETVNILSQQVKDSSKKIGKIDNLLFFGFVVMIA